jgi:hypothetical protein
MIKANLMTITMMNSMNGNLNKDNNNGIYIYSYMIKWYIIPNLIIIKEYYNEKSSKLINIIYSTKNNIKSSSITIQVNISDHDNILEQALLYYK